jgi:hypothetical protein
MPAKPNVRAHECWEWVASPKLPAASTATMTQQLKDSCPKDKQGVLVDRCPTQGLTGRCAASAAMSVTFGATKFVYAKDAKEAQLAEPGCRMTNGTWTTP